RVTISGLNSTQTAGHPDGFSVTFENRSKQPIVDLHSAFVVHLDGLQPGAVRIFRNGAELIPSSNNGDLVFTDPEPWFSIDRTQMQRRYQIFFQPEAPTGDGELAAVALAANGSQLGSDSASFALRAGDGRATPTPSHSVSPAATVNVPIPTGPAV